MVPSPILIVTKFYLLWKLVTDMYTFLDDQLNSWLNSHARVLVVLYFLFLLSTAPMSKKIVYAECPTPSTKEEYEAAVESMFANVISEENNASWKSYAYSDQGESGFKDILFS
jgi:hypothetical protein